MISFGMSQQQLICALTGMLLFRQNRITRMNLSRRMLSTGLMNANRYNVNVELVLLNAIADITGENRFGRFMKSINEVSIDL